MHPTGTAPSNEASREAETWCLGCRRAGDRTLTGGERRWIAGLRDAHLARAVLGLAIPPLALGFPLALAALAGDRTGGPVAAAAFAAVLGALLLALPVGILLVRDHLRAWRDLGADLAGGEAWTFESPAVRDAADAEDEAAAAPPGFALLPNTRRVVDPASTRPDTSREELLETDAHRGATLYAPLSLRVTAPAPDLRFAQRPLSAGERHEIERVRRALSRPRPSTVTAFVLLVVLLAVSRLAAEGFGDGRVPRWTDALSAVLAIVICVRALMRYTRCVLLAGRMARDLDTGLVVSVRGGGEPDAEMLPFSRLFWRVAGAPAGWRDRRRAAETLRASL